MAMSAFGTIFSTGTLVGEITGITFGGITVTPIDVSVLTSADKLYIAGFSDGGSITVSMMAAPAAPSLLSSNTTTSVSYVIQFGGAGTTKPTVSFAAFIQSLTFEAQVDGVVMSTLTLRIDGAVTIANQV